MFGTYSRLALAHSKGGPVGFEKRVRCEVQLGLFLVAGLGRGGAGVWFIRTGRDGRDRGPRAREARAWREPGLRRGAEFFIGTRDAARGAGARFGSVRCGGWEAVAVARRGAVVSFEVLSPTYLDAVVARY